MAEDGKGAEGAEGAGEGEGATRQKPEPAKGGDEVQAVVAKNRELLGEVRALKAKVREQADLKEFGDADAIREAFEFKEKAERERAEKAGEFEKLRAKDREAHARELGKRDAREQKLGAALERRLIESEFSKVLRDAGGDPKYLVPVARPRMKTVETEDDWEIVVHDARGQPSTMEALIDELRKEYPRAFEGTGASGSGTQAGTGGGGQGKVDPTDPEAVGRAADAWLRSRKKTAA